MNPIHPSRLVGKFTVCVALCLGVWLTDMAGVTEPSLPAPTIFTASDDAETAFQKITGFQSTNDLPDFGDMQTTEARDRCIRKQLTKAMEALQVKLACRDFYARFPHSPRYAELRHWESIQLLLSSDVMMAQIRASQDLNQIDAAQDKNLDENDRIWFALRNASDRAYRESLITGVPRAQVEWEYVARIASRNRTSQLARDALLRVSLALPNAKVIDALRSTYPNDSEVAACIGVLESVGKPCGFEFTAMDGRPVSSTDYRGKVVLLEFWAKGCPPCIQSIPDLKKILTQYGSQRFAIVGINLDEDRADAEDIIKHHELTWPQYFDGKGWKNSMAKRFLVSSIPHGIMIDRQGNLRSLDSDVRMPETKLLIETLLAEPATAAKNQP